MITPTAPMLTEQVDREEVRKALLDLARQMNEELKKLQDRVYALENP